MNVIIKADRPPPGQHRGRYNGVIVEEVAVILSDQDATVDGRDIILKSREDGLKQVSENHRSYDSLQYPLLHTRDIALYQKSKSRNEKALRCCPKVGWGVGLLRL